MSDTAAACERTFTTSDGYRCRYRYFPAEAARAHVVCLHGIQSHGGWYEHSCQVLARAGFAVSFLDRRGSGLNTEARGDAPGFRRLLDDLADFLRHVRAAARRAERELPHPEFHAPRPRLPVFLVAISWGGKLAVALQRRHPGLVDGLALLCPGFCPRVRLTLRERLAILWARLTRPGRLFPIPLGDPALFTANPERQEYIRHDPLSLRRATARFLLESARLDGYLRFCPRHVRVPVLLQLAEHDRIIDNTATRAFVKRFACPERRIIEYPGAHHTLEFDPDPEPFLADLVGWLGEQAERPRPGPA